MAKSAVEVRPSSEYSYRLVQIIVSKKYDSETKVSSPEVDEKGLPVWSVETLRSHPNDEEKFEVKVKISSATKPNIEEFQEVEFTNLIGRQWAMKSGSGGISWRADSVSPKKK